MPTKSNITEESVQAAIVKYIKWKHPNVRYCASLGGIRTTFRQAAKAKRTGYIKGKNDLDIYEARGGYHALFLEIKKDKKSYPTPEQKRWLQDMEQRGYHAIVVKGVDEAVEAIEKYLAMQTTIVCGKCLKNNVS